jgi:hypothetical protein
MKPVCIFCDMSHGSFLNEKFLVIVEEIKTHILYSELFSRKSYRDNMKKNIVDRSRPRARTHAHTRARQCGAFHAGYLSVTRAPSTTAAVVTRTRLSVTLYVSLPVLYRLLFFRA